MAKKRDLLAETICERLHEALDAHPRIETIAEVVRRTGQQDKTVRRWFDRKGPTTPGLSATVVTCHVLDVSLDWLLTGHYQPVGWAQWLEFRRKPTDPPAMVTYLRELPLHGYRARLDFYVMAVEAYRKGTHDEHPPDAFVTHVRGSLPDNTD